MKADCARYLLGALAGNIADTEALNSHRITVELDHLTKDARAFFEGFPDQITSDDLLIAFRSEKAANAYLLSRHLHHQTPVPESLETFLRQSEFLQWNLTVIAPSSVKGTERRIYRSSDMSVAQTILDGVLRETEVIQQRDSGSRHWDFYVYDHAGQLTTESQFYNSRNRTVLGSSPRTCMACHYDGKSRSFQRRPLSYGGRLASFLMPFPTLPSESFPLRLRSKLGGRP